MAWWWESKLPKNEYRPTIYDMFEKSECDTWSKFALENLNRDLLIFITWTDLVDLMIEVTRETARKNEDEGRDEIEAELERRKLVRE